ncbi:MAG: retron system putative HNH endonuclease [Limisphaerales bacterium]
MIQVHRVPKPGILVRKETKWKAAIHGASTPNARKNAQHRYEHKEIKAALVRMFHGKCAYCESSITHFDYGHIEHFKPKAIPAYFELAVEWNNLLLACGRCNGTENKGIKFLGPAEGGPLVNPAEENPADHLRFDFDLGTRLANVLGSTERGETTWKTLGLNRPELVRRRSDFVKKLWVIGARYYDDAEAREIIDLAVRDSAEYAAFARELKHFIDSRRPL